MTVMERLQAADPARRLEPGVPPLARVAAVRRRRHTRTAATGAALALAATLALGLPLPRGTDVVARAAAALDAPGILHTVTVSRGPGGGGSAETWRAANGDERVVLRSASGRLVGELSLRGDVALSWNADDDVVDRTRNSALDDDPLTLLARARAGAPGVEQRADATVRGIPVHVVALAAARAGDDAAPERVYYLDKRTFLPVRIVFGATVTDVLSAERLPTADLSLSPHPTATRR